MEEPCELPTRGAGTHSIVDDGRGDADAGRGTGPRHDSPHDQPATQRGELTATGGSVRTSLVPGGGGLLHQRDDPIRPRDPAYRVARRPAELRVRPLSLIRPQRG